MKHCHSNNPFRSCLTLAGLISLGCSTAHAGVVSTGPGENLSTTSGSAATTDPNSAEELAKKLSNPIASMISVPFQNNFDWGGGPRGDGFQWKMNIQPVIPISLSEKWNLITRTIIPVISQDDIAGTALRPSGTQTGLGDVLFSGWFSPVKPTSNGWILGIGPALSFPTGTETLLTSNKWSAGPTAIALRQSGKWTYGALVNHLWDYAGDDNRSSVNNTFLQPFIALNLPGGWTYSLNAESSYNWQASQWTVPINLSVSKLVKFGKQPVQFQLGGRYYADAPDNGPDWGMRFAATWLFPKS